jgi:pyruvate formate lyase activating enzyme
MGLWLEVVTLLIPGFNDSEDELKGLADSLVSVSPYIPWHVTAFHKDYKMDDPADTRPQDLLRAAAIGKRAGLRYIYAGNLPGSVGDLEDTRCHSCGDTLIRRRSYFVEDYRLTADGCCPSCNTQIPGRWAARFEDQITDRPFLPRRSSGLVTISS